MQKRIKVFLGAYINQTNAQNLNCRALARYFNKSRFKVYTLTIGHGNLGKVSIPGVKIFNCVYPVKITQYLGFLWGVWNCQVAYLPRGNNYLYQKKLLNFFKRKSFKTIENIIDQEALNTALSSLGGIVGVKESFSFTDRLYSITTFMKHHNFDGYGIESESLILPPVIEIDRFEIRRSEKVKLDGIVFLSNDMKRKRVDEFINLSLLFPMLSFHIVGSDKHGFLNQILQNGDYENIHNHGMLNHEDLNDVLESCQLHVLMSRSEGFPRGIIECAAAGLPSLVYNDYGASEWIAHLENGIVCKDFEDFKVNIEKLTQMPDLLVSLSKGAIQLAHQFSAPVVTKLYEEVIEDLYAS